MSDSSLSLPEMPLAAEITRKSRSNLAFAFATLPRARRRDAVTFYAFCRWVDDLADDDDQPLEERRALLERWHSGCLNGFHTLEQSRALEHELDAVVERRGIDRNHLATIVEGMIDDLSPKRFDTVEEVEAYNWKVACCVGLVSIRIFGCRDQQSEAYAISLGQALQWTNILRDVGEDWRERRRVYLPQAVMARFMLTDRDLAAGQGDDRFRAMMEYLAERARGHFAAARASRRKSELRSLAAAEGMRRIYRALLEEMSCDGFRVFEHRYSLSRGHKLWLLLKPFGKGK